MAHSWSPSSRRKDEGGKYEPSHRASNSRSSSRSSLGLYSSPTRTSCVRCCSCCCCVCVGGVEDEDDEEEDEAQAVARPAAPTAAPATVSVTTKAVSASTKAATDGCCEKSSSAASTSITEKLRPWIFRPFATRSRSNSTALSRRAGPALRSTKLTNNSGAADAFMSSGIGASLKVFTNLLRLLAPSWAADSSAGPCGGLVEA
mmetsp:Transcript_70111/g.200936  ORF Transcript_70111/g.200936 Transcript_70111/m.200936 type:complete len:203 (-) Transcript_70111:2704-3312(-)